MSRVVHFEIHASNPERVLEFYRTLFGCGAFSAEFPWARTGCVEIRPVRDIDTVRRRVTGPGSSAA